MTDSNYEILVSNIEMLMRNKNINQATLINETGIAQSQMSKALNRNQKTQFTFEQIWAIADYFNVSIDFLVGRKATADISEKMSNKEICKYLIQLIESEVVTCPEIGIEESMFEEIPAPHSGYPCEQINKTNTYRIFYFSNYPTPDIEGLDEFTLDDLAQDLYINGNFDSKSKELNDFLAYYFKLYDLLKHNSLDRDIFDQAISAKLDTLQE